MAHLFADGVGCCRIMLMDHPQRTVKNSELANLSFDQFDPAYQAQILELRKIIDKRITAKQFQNFTITGTSTKEGQASLSCGCGGCCGHGWKRLGVSARL